MKKHSETASAALTSINHTFPSLFHVRKKPNSSTLKRQLGSKTKGS